MEQKDDLRGLKENVIVGLIPSQQGTGSISQHRRKRLKGEDLSNRTDLIIDARLYLKLQKIA